VKICMLLASAYVIMSRWALTVSVVKFVNIGAVAFLLLAPLSAAWSVAPDVTLLRCVSLTAICLLCFAISLVGWHRKRFQQLSTLPLMAILVISLVVGMIYPDRITEQGTDISQIGAWHGITHAKNEFGMIASLAAIICIHSWLAKEGRAAWALLG